LGLAVLRITTILAPAYFTIFCAQQYLNHRRLYESYAFKDITLQTMLNLRGRVTGTREQDLILSKSLDVLFSEPFLKEDIKYDKNMVWELLRLLKRD